MGKESDGEEGGDARKDGREGRRVNDERGGKEGEREENEREALGA